MNTSRQLTDLIKNKAHSLGLDAQLLLKRYFMEQMLVRISRSRYRNNFILKGGLLISSLTGLTTRTTKDIDVSIINNPLSKTDIEKMMLDICKIEVDDNIKFELLSMEDIREEFDYPGIRLSFKVYMDKIVDALKMDITTGDVITPKEITYGYKTILDEKIINICSYPIETILAEKIQSILSKNILSTRMRDYYDVYMLENIFRDRIDLDIQKEALFNTCKKRNSENDLVNAREILGNIRNDFGQKHMWDSYVSKNTYATGVQFEQTIKSIFNILKLLNLTE